MVQARPEDAPRSFAEVEGMKADLRRLEKLPKPVVAAINGAALGGGFEIALACQHRILLDDPKAEVGLPEASLGLLPGGGGVTRVTRMLGLQSALMDVLLQGTRFKPAEALKKQLVHELVGDARRAGAGRQEVDPRAPRRRRGRAEPVGPARIQDARRHAQVPRAGGVPAGVPRAAAPADQGRELPRAARDPVGRRRGRDGRHRHRTAHRVALHHQPDGRSERQEHDPGLLVRPPGDQRGQVPPGRASRPSGPPRSPSSARA